ncbi:MAG: ammonia-forming cytochrome c nitrite reductase subunit c552 [Labilithrix sp.]
MASSPRSAWAIVAGGAIVVTAASAAVWRPARAARTPGAPGASTALGYVGSSSCLPCHPGEHASWSRTWHRTMTQPATPDTVLAPFERRGPRGHEEVWYEGKRVVLTTGAHREQAYWAAGERGALEILPVVWLPQERALVPRRDAFILPPDEPLPTVRWGGSCIACHAVAGEPHRDAAKDAWDTRVAELGVACEACHGPGAAHAEQYRDPVARYSKAADKHIVHPAKLDAARSNAVCGQCHAYAYPRDDRGWWRDGYSKTFRAGDALGPSRMLLDPGAMSGDNGAPEIDAPASAIFWPDGDVRVGGREYNALVLSKCKATCVDCHSLHAGDPAGQLAPDRTCTTSCHASARMTTHAKHSAAVTCADCHMPKTSYALLSAVRSHRISIPRLEDDDGKPSACHLCHLDRDDWAARVGARGDAGLRALVADALGASPNARYARPILDALGKDRYAAVRFIVERSKRKLPPVDGLSPITLAAPDERAMTIAE